MLVLLASFLVAVGGVARGADVRFQQANAPFTFTYAKALSVSSHLDDSTPAALLRDYSEDDNYRAFLVEVRARALGDGETLTSIADGLVAETRRRSQHTDLIVIANGPVTYHDAPAQRFEVEYVLTTERIDFTRPDGKERQTAAGALHMRREAIVQVKDGKVFTLMLTASRDQYGRRRPQYETVLRTFAPTAR